MYTTHPYPINEDYKNSSEWEIFEDIYYRSDVILKNYPPSLIDKHIKCVNFWRMFLAEYKETEERDGVNHIIGRGLPDWLLEEIPDHDRRNLVSATDAYIIFHGKDLMTLDFIDEVKWDLFFALFATAQIDNCYFIDSIVHKNMKVFKHYDRRMHFMGYAIDAIESVHYAELLNYQRKEIEYSVEREISERNRRAGKKKHERINNLLKELFEFYMNGSFKSMSDAIEQFIATTDNDELSLLVPTNMRRTLREHLSRLIRSTEKYK